MAPGGWLFTPRWLQRPQTLKLRALVEIQLRHLGSSSVPLGLDALISLGKGGQAAAGGCRDAPGQAPSRAGPGRRRWGGPTRVGLVLFRSPPPSRTVGLFKAVAGETACRRQEPTPGGPLLPAWGSFTRTPRPALMRASPVGRSRPAAVSSTEEWKWRSCHGAKGLEKKPAVAWGLIIRQSKPWWHLRFPHQPWNTLTGLPSWSHPRRRPNEARHEGATVAAAGRF